MSKKSPFAIHKALIGIGGELKTVKRLRFGDILIETHTALQTKSFLLANTFLDSPVTICPHKSLNTSRGVISESDLLSTPESEILEGFFDQGVIQVRRITIKKAATIIPTKHLILTFNRPKLPPAIKAGYLQLQKFARTFRTLCAVLSARGSDTHKFPAAVNLLALEPRLHGTRHNTGNFEMRMKAGIIPVFFSDPFT
ncbi:putative RNA-directed DNA polymerase from transposon BS [Trichonephila clavipes]|nr:putative RNA-directed DNA polymerase from transposon BS [Trichonephila clavipes]